MTKWRLILTGCFLLALGILAYKLTRVTPAGQVTLPDGTTVTLAGISYGKTNCWPPDNSWRRYLNFLPDSILRRMKLHSSPAWRLGTNQMIVWVFAKSAGPSSNVQTFTKCSIVDEQSNECYSSMGLSFSGWPAVRNQQSIKEILLPTFPRRDRYFKLRFYSGPFNDSKALGDLTIPNPVLRQYPEWKPTALPATQTNQDVAVTLRKLETGYYFDSTNPASKGQDIWGRADFAFSEGGKPSTNWQVETVKFTDATGNDGVVSAWAYREKTDSEGTFYFKSVLWPSESAWKLTATLKHKLNSEFAKADVWTITNLPVPSLGLRMMINPSTNVNGVNVQLRSVLTFSSSADERFIMFDFKPPTLPPDMRFEIVGATGYDDQSDSNSSPHPARYNGGGNYSPNYVLPTSVRRLEVTVTVYHQPTVEFIAKPDLAMAGK